jgi:hypothetical protein
VEAETEPEESDGFWMQTDTDENEGSESFSDSAASIRQGTDPDPATPWPPTPSSPPQAIDGELKAGYEVSMFDDPLSVPDALISHRKRSSP